MGQGYWPTSWGSPPGGQAPPPCGSPSLRTPPLRPMTSTSPTVRQTYVKIGFICLLNYFAFLTCPFICLSGQLWITTWWRARIWLRWQPLELNRRIQRQRHDVVVVVFLLFAIVLVSLVVNYIVLSCRTCFSFACRQLYCGFDDVYDYMLCEQYSSIFCLFWRLPIQERQPK
jgi:hypothetical protein